MSSYLTFTSPTLDDTNVRPLAGFEPDEFQYMALALVQRLRERSIPPDDAYWWTRALCAEPYMRTFPDISEVLVDRPFIEQQCRVA
jgi:hypothetical protein